ncbi:MAG: hypothetical protein ACOC42_04150, partial [Halobacteriota archaeon]
MTAGTFGGTLGVVTGRGGPGVAQNGPPQQNETGERTIEWDGQRGSEWADWECEDGEQACWHWILTPGGPEPYEEVGELTVTFDDDDEMSVSGDQAGRGAYHFYVCRQPGGTIDEAWVEVTGGGSNALLTISDVECEPGESEVVYWQLDFGVGESPPIPPKYWDDDFMSALGDSVNGVTANPHNRRQETEGQLDDVDILDKQFHFDDEDEPTSVTVDFEIDEEGDSRVFHLALFELPGPFDEDEIDEQTKIDQVSG